MRGMQVRGREAGIGWFQAAVFPSSYVVFFLTHFVEGVLMTLRLLFGSGFLLIFRVGVSNGEPVLAV